MFADLVRVSNGMLVGFFFFFFVSILSYYAVLCLDKHIKLCEYATYLCCVDLVRASFNGPCGSSGISHSSDIIIRRQFIISAIALYAQLADKQANTITNSAKYLRDSQGSFWDL